MKTLVVPKKAALSLADLVWQEQVKPIPAVDEVLVRTVAVGLNPVDYKVIENGGVCWQYPHTIGLDLAGIVEAVGSQVTNLVVGDRVAGHGDLSTSGTFAEYAAVKALALAVIPESVSFEIAAASLCAGLTAYQALFRKANLTEAVKTILIPAGAGGVGSLAIQLAKAVGYQVITTVSTNKRDFALGLGADVVLDYRQEDVDNRLVELTDGRGIDVIIDTVGEAQADLERLAYNGQLVCLLELPTGSLISEKALTVSQIDLGGAHRSGNDAQIHDLGRMTAALLDLIATGRVTPIIEQILSPQEIPAGLERIKANQVVGKLVARF